MFVGLLVVLFFIEIGLRGVGGMHYATSFSRAQKSKNSRSEPTVLCIGDSFVYGVGAPLSSAFPEQLERLFKAHGMAVRVVNRGIGGQNTAMIVKNLPKQADRYKPDIVVVLAGTNNRWSSQAASLKFDSVGGALDAMLQNSKLYKFAKLLIMEASAYRFRKERKVTSEQPVRNTLKCNSKNIQYPQFILTDTKRMGNHSDSVGRGTFEDAWQSVLRSQYSVARNIFKRNCVQKKERILNVWGLGMSYCLEGDYGSAARILQNGVVVHGEDSRLYNALGEIALLRDELESAEVWFTKGIGVNECDVRNYVGMGRVCFQRREYEKALQWYTQAKELNPGDAYVYYHVGKYHAFIRNFDAAMAFFEQGVRLDPFYKDNYGGIAEVYFMQGLYQNAREWYEKVLQLDPHDVDTVFMIARTYYSQQMFTETAARVNRGINTGRALRGRVTPDVLFCACKEGLDCRAVQAYLKKTNKSSHYDIVGRAYVLRSTIDADIRQWIERDMKSIRDICAKNNARLLVLSYPEKNSGDQREVSQLLQAIALHHKIPFVDIFSEFEQLGSNKMSYFSADTHCNERGYALIAERVYTALMREFPEVLQPGCPVSSVQSN